jgi:hypothetical protein
MRPFLSARQANTQCQILLGGKRSKSILRRLSLADGNMFVLWVWRAGNGKYGDYRGGLSVLLNSGARFEYAWKLTEVDQRIKRGMVISDLIDLQISNKIIILLLSKPALICHNSEGRLKTIYVHLLSSFFNRCSPCQLYLEEV